MVEEDQAVRIPPTSAHCRVTIHGSLPRDPEAVESRENGTKPIICRARDTPCPRRVGEWPPVSHEHR